jgi:hypothetical protein
MTLKKQLEWLQDALEMCEKMKNIKQANLIRRNIEKKKTQYSALITMKG